MELANSGFAISIFLTASLDLVLFWYPPSRKIILEPPDSQVGPGFFYLKK